MQNSDFDRPDPSLKADSDIKAAIHAHRFFLSEPWFRCNQCSYWIEQNFLQVAVLLSISWLCAELCVYFGALLFLGGLIWIYKQATEKTSKS